MHILHSLSAALQHSRFRCSGISHDCHGFPWDPLSLTPNLPLGGRDVPDLRGHPPFQEEIYSTSTTDKLLTLRKLKDSCPRRSTFTHAACFPGVEKICHSARTLCEESSESFLALPVLHQKVPVNYSRSPKVTGRAGPGHMRDFLSLSTHLVVSKFRVETPCGLQELWQHLQGWLKLTFIQYLC